MFECNHKLATYLLQFREEIAAKTQEIDRETRRKIKLERDLKTVKGELEASVQEVKAKQNQLQKGEDEYKRCEQQLRETRVCRLHYGLLNTMSLLCVVLW